MLPAAEAPPAASGRLITAAIVAVAMLVTASAADGSLPGRNGDIAFDAKFDCGFEHGAIGVMGPDGSARRQISECDWNTYDPVWTADGRRLSYWARGVTWLMSADGSERREMSRGIAPSFAPNGVHYAYVRYRGPVKRIWRARIDGGEGRHLRAGRSPLWSPDGRMIAYYRKGVWLMNARTGERLRRVAPRWMTPLDWSPDGRRLLCSGYADGSDLYAVRADGKRRPRRLTRTPARSESDAAWSPDGRRIVVGALTRPDNFHTQHSS
jgi:Tol biopolymer transport system component